jgi:hypothetical protein
MAKMTKKQLGSRGKKIMAEAKRIQKKHPRKKWTSCVAAAGKKMKGKK